MANSFVFYQSFHSALRNLDAETYKQAMEVICEYAFTGETPECDGVVALAFELIKPQIDANAKRRENGKKGGRPKQTKEEPNQNQTVTKPKPKETKSEPSKTTPEPNENVNVNVNDNVKEKENKKKSAPRFSPPTVAQVKKFCDDHGYHLDAQRFVDYYTSNGWMVGRNKMKDWQAAARNWAKKNDTVVSGTKFTNYQSERRTDYDDLERRLIAQSMGG